MDSLLQKSDRKKNNIKTLNEILNETVNEIVKKSKYITKTIAIL